jgi:hypothetical protein
MQVLNETETSLVGGGLVPLLAVLIWTWGNVSNLRDFANGISDRILAEGMRPQ